MSASSEVTAGQEVLQVQMARPHVVILGAGASRATCMNGDRNGKHLPLMSDFTQLVGLGTLLSEWAINPQQNLEDIFSKLYESGETEKTELIQKIVRDYFDAIEIQDNPTIYDHLILSLREQDIIATFNWDPLLLAAYVRNKGAVDSLPRLAFLHGNVSVGLCEADKKAGLLGERCTMCNELFSPVPLLYPIGQKDYESDVFIRNEWSTFKNGLQNAFMVTVFGYSAPKTDESAIAAMRSAWGEKTERELEQIAFITTQAEADVAKNWEPFIHTHHYELQKDFYHSWIANHPRRTGEAWINQYIEAKFVENNPMPKDVGFRELWEWCEKFRAPEVAAKNQPKAAPHS